MRRQRLIGICGMAMIGVLLTVSKEALAFLPNFEPVSLLTVLFTLTFGPWAMGGTFVFVLLEGLLYGFGSWWVMYLYVWPLLAGISWLLRKRLNKAWQWALVSGLYGLAFGALCSFTYLPVGGVKMMFAWVVSGLPFDVSHGVCNFLLMFVLYRPLRAALEKIRALALKA